MKDIIPLLLANQCPRKVKSVGIATAQGPESGGSSVQCLTALGRNIMGGRPWARLGYSMARRQLI
jgi:hypothetical protein